MSSLAVIPNQAPAVSEEQIDLIKRTVAKDATPDELRLYFYDCARRNVHPLDKLIHFTKRNGKYTPITSIDFMRSQASDSGDYAGNDDPQFHWAGDDAKYPEAATVTVYRMVQGQRCAFTATARWAEYFPGDALGFMWKKMPCTMLGKCAEGLALRKAFPRQLAGLYSAEEMDQSGKGPKTIVDAGELRDELPAEAVEISGLIAQEHESDTHYWYLLVTEGKKQIAVCSPKETDSGRLAEKLGWWATVKGVQIESVKGKQAYALADVLSVRQPEAASQPTPKPADAPQGKPASAAYVTVPKRITVGQQKRLWAIAKEKKLPEASVKAIYGSHGFEHVDEITMQAYDKVIADVEQAGALLAEQVKLAPGKTLEITEEDGLPF